MPEAATKAIAVVGVGAILPDAPTAATFWENVAGACYSIGEVDATRWDPALYFDPDPKAPEKTYSKIGGWVTDWEWDPLGWRLPIPPTVSDAMDDAQKWAVASARMALLDYGWPDRDLAGERTAVILGNAMAGEKHYLTALRIAFPELARELAKAPSFAALDRSLRDAVEAELHANLDAWLPGISEDTMPGELGNCLAGRVANLFDFHGPNFVTDAACASAMAAMAAAIDGLLEHDFDVALTGGVDRNMGASTFVKFAKIGALSATGTRPYADGADGFVMGEGAAVFVLKRLADAERDGDRIYAVVRGVAGASDGRGKGITAPNPVGQRLAVQRAWQSAGLSPAACGLVEGHGTSTRVGDVVEVTSIGEAFAGAGLAPGSVALGSVKSNIGHLKGAAGAAGLLKAILALHHRRLPPSLNFAAPNPNIDFAATPFSVNTELRDWAPRNGYPRVAGVSAFGFGGTNFHVVLEEHVPGRLTADGGRTVVAGADLASAPTPSGAEPKAPLRGALVVGAADEAELADRLRAALVEARAGRAPAPQAPDEDALRAPERVAIDYGDAAELADRVERALGAIDKGVPAAWRVLRGRGVFRGHGPAPTTAFLYTGQGSQYVNMLADLRDVEPIVAQTFAEADEVMTPLLGGRPLTDYIFVDPEDADAVATAEAELRQTEITQPAVLAVDAAITRLLEAYGIVPDLVMGHSLGEYGALTAAGALDFAAALEAVSARGQEMASLEIDDNGALAAVAAPLDEAERLVDGLEGYVVLANVNSTTQTVIGGATDAVEHAIVACEERGYRAVRLPVSHAFHTAIVAPASAPLRATLERLQLHPPVLPIVANVTGDLYPMGPDVVPQMLDLLADQVASPVQFVAGLRTLRAAGATAFVEVGPKRALQGFASDVLGDDDVLNLFTNHPKGGGVVTFNHALCGLYAAGLGVGRVAEVPSVARTAPAPAPASGSTAAEVVGAVPAPRASADEGTYLELGHLFAEFLDRARGVYAGQGADGEATPLAEPVVITGAALGLPGTAKVFDDANVARILHGQQFIDVIPSARRHEIAERHITRLVKGDDGSAVFERIDSPADVIKLAARGGEFDLAAEFGVDPERLAALGRDTQLAIAAGLDALHDAGLPLAQQYKTTTTGTHLPERWALPGEVADETGVIFASAFPGLDAFADDMNRFWQDRSRRDELASLEHLRTRLAELDGEESLSVAEVDRCIHDLRLLLDEHAYAFDRRFLFRILSMGHSQFAELVGARGPNTQVNAACASTTQAVALAEDWIRAGRCRRVVIVAADDATSDHLLGWIGAGFLASGAAATDEIVEEAALPFDQRRHGMILGMGAAALVVESAAAARDRGIHPICEVLGTVTANSAFHGTRLDVDHIASMMERVVAEAESRGGVSRDDIAPETVFVSHETYTPARGGSAAAEIYALRQVFGDRADQIVIANTKGLTGHPMGVGIEDVVAVKALETALVPPVPNVQHTDPEFGPLNLSKGGVYPVRFALRLAAGFGSQIAMSMLRWTPLADGRHRNPEELGYAYRITDHATWQAWLTRVAGVAQPELEVVDRRLRIVDQGPDAGAHAPEIAAPAVTPVANAAPVPPVEVPVEPPPPPATAPAAPVVGEDEVTERVVALVAEQTGYPADLLDLDLDLEADLGIDTVKQAEVFAAIREAYGIPRDENLKLRDYPTLASVIGFVRDRAPAGAAVAPPPTTAPEAPAAGLPLAAGEDEVEVRVVALVAEQTGYPADLLDLDLDLEADLGIDTVKQAEVFAAIREAYGIPRDENLQLRDYPTLASVIGFVHDRRPLAGEAEAGESSAPDTPTGAEPAPGTARDSAFPRRVPVPVVRPPLAVCAPTGVTLGAGSRVLLVADAGGVGAALTTRLESLGVEVLTVDDRPDATTLEQRLATWCDSGPLHGVYWLPGLDDEGPITGLDADQWHAALHIRVKLAAVAMRALADQISPPGTFMVSATRLGGRHGYDPSGATAPLGGAVSGFTKALSRERAEALVKVVDVGAEVDADTVADLLIEETRHDPATVEVGHADGLRWTIGLAEQSVVADPDRVLGAESVVVVTGSAGSIVSAITAELAAASGATFHLLDLVPAPDGADPDLGRFVTDLDGLKRELAERITARGDRATPRLIDHELAGIERARAALEAITAVQAAGGVAHWHQVDLTDGRAVAAVIDAIRAESARVDVLLHCAGLEISRFLADKPQAEYDLVFDVKADGFFHLLHALGDTPLGAAVVFSSIAGRFGNGGQTDYSAANDLLCKLISSFRSTRPDTRGIAIDWTAWAGIGMASRGSIPKMMALAGIDMLPPEVGIPVVRREIEAGGPGRELVVAGALGVLVDEPDPAGGLDPTAAGEGLGAADAPRLLAHEVVGATTAGGLIVRAQLDPTVQPFLDHHRIDDTAVLPGVMGVEAFAEAAVLLAPGWQVAAVEEVDFLAPFKFYRDEPRVIEVVARLVLDGDELVAACRLVGRRTLADQGEQETVHFTGRVRLTRAAAALPPAAGAPAEVPATAVGPGDVYRIYFHGPAYQVLGAAWGRGGIAYGRLADDLGPDRLPADAPLCTAPRLLELCFQAAGVHQLATSGVMALPTHADRVVVAPGPVGSTTLIAVVTPRDDGSVDAEVVDPEGRVWLRLEGYRTTALPGALGDDLLAPLRAAIVE